MIATTTIHTSVKKIATPVPASMAETRVERSTRRVRDPPEEEQAARLDVADRVQELLRRASAQAVSQNAYPDNVRGDSTVTGTILFIRQTLARELDE